jgi:putative tryptophan/tyrosine transport system substrate-binding protein
MCRVLRRDLITLLGGAAAAWPIKVGAQADRVWRMSVLLFSAQDRMSIKPLLDELQARGYVDGKTIKIEYRDAEGNYDRLPELAAELVRLGPDVLFAFSGELAPVMKKATATIPTVVVVSNDPVASGIVASLARPGGNITGLTFIYDQLAGKAIELLREVVPSVSRVAVLWNPDHADPEFRETQHGARALQIQIQSLEVREPRDFEAAFQAAGRQRPEALIVFGSRLMQLHRQRIGDFVEKNKLILVGNPSWLSGIGGLLTYGPNVADLMRRAASYVEKILKGAKPADLPMQQPTAFELVVNLKAAKALHLSIPTQLLARADEVIE